MPLDCPNKLSSPTAILAHRTQTQDTLRRLGRPTAILGRRWDGLKVQKPLQSLVWDGGTAGTGGGGYATVPSRHWTLNCLLSRQRKGVRGVGPIIAQRSQRGRSYNCDMPPFSSGMPLRYRFRPEARIPRQAASSPSAATSLSAQGRGPGRGIIFEWFIGDSQHIAHFLGVT